MFSSPSDVAATVPTITTQLANLFVDLFTVAPILAAIGGAFILWNYITKKMELKLGNSSSSVSALSPISSASDMGLNLSTMDSGSPKGSAEDSLYKVIALEEAIASQEKMGRRIDPAFRAKVDGISSRAFDI